MSTVSKKNIIIIAALFLAVLFFVTMGDDDGSELKTKDQRTPALSLQLLQEGNERFVNGDSLHPRTDNFRLEQAGMESQGDHAFATVLGCSDSRVPVERIFDAGVMDIFVIRVAGNVVQGDEAGSIEYGLAHVNTPLLVVLGHTQCGAVTAVTNAIEGHGHALERNIPGLVAPIAPAVEKSIKHTGKHGADVIPVAIEQNVWQSVHDLFMVSPSTRELVKSGKVQVVGAIYDVATGRVKWLKEDKPMAILAEVEANPARAMEAMAGGHAEETAAEDHKEAVAPEHQEPANEAGHQAEATAEPAKEEQVEAARPLTAEELKELAAKAAEAAKAAAAAAEAATKAAEEAAKAAAAQ
ncbi:carbonic anhydrase [Desulfovibrio mangrovi]|uniref:carbonic anhydrase n=1 Tax=Desulfovibrio mangrovi TaxID=2976983 RepID=UPI002246DB27|nr:carbonic anhydrase [Desulfovibrio mangrovi]UZP68022.1 carbonic anhydrase [Desulfovibrio mangrovi]